MRNPTKCFIEGLRRPLNVSQPSHCVRSCVGSLVRLCALRVSRVCSEKLVPCLADGWCGRAQCLSGFWRNSLGSRRIPEGETLLLGLKGRE